MRNCKSVTNARERLTMLTRMPVVVLLNANALSEAQLAEVCGLSVRHVARLTDQKVLRKGKRGYKLSESVRAYVKHRESIIKRECSKFGDGYNAARARRMFALATSEEQRVRLQGGELLERK